MSNGGKKGDREQPQQQRRPKPSRSSATSAGPGRMVRIIASIALALHVVVLFLYPLANSRTSPTVLAITQSSYVRWYADPLYLNHGYGFFGPDPGPSTLVEYEVFGEGGESIVKGTFPDAERSWPRLRYHRHKMLADQIDFPGYPPERRQFVLKGFAKHLIRQHGGEQATVTAIIHHLVTHQEWLDGMAIDDKSKYERALSVRQSQADVEIADAALESLPSSERSESTGPAETILPGGTL